MKPARPVMSHVETPYESRLRRRITAKRTVRPCIKCGTRFRPTWRQLVDCDYLCPADRKAKGRENHARLRHRMKERGLCEKCCRRPRDPVTAQHCAPCRAAHRRANRRYYGLNPWRPGSHGRPPLEARQ